jgi:hypothetical protein
MCQIADYCFQMIFLSIFNADNQIIECCFAFIELLHSKVIQYNLTVSNLIHYMEPLMFGCIFRSSGLILRHILAMRINLTIFDFIT